MAAMIRKVLTVWFPATLGVLLLAASVFGQSGLPPASPPSSAPTLGQPQPLPSVAAPTNPSPPLSPPNAAVYPPPPPPPPPPAPTAPPLYQPHDPGPNGWGPYNGSSAEPTFLLNAEIQLLQPHLTNNLTHTVTLSDGTTTTVAIPGASLNFTASPEFEIGYRLSESLGEFLLGYRFLGSSGTASLSDAPLNSSVKTRLSVNVVDFDYSTTRYSPVPRWDMKWWVGLRYASAFFDNQQTNAFQNIHASNDFSGAGPHAGLEVQRHIGPLPSFAVFARLDGATLIGPLKQRFSQSQLDGAGNLLAGESDERRTQTVPTINIRAGASYSPPKWETFRFSAGYQFEQWWSLGQLGDSRGELSSHGGFLRMELDF
jgi:Legionella pneumophila major outer membrane protein precursor